MQKNVLFLILLFVSSMVFAVPPVVQELKPGQVTFKFSDTVGPKVNVKVKLANVNNPKDFMTATTDLHGQAKFNLVQGKSYKVLVNGVNVSFNKVFKADAKAVNKVVNIEAPQAAYQVEGLGAGGGLGAGLGAGAGAGAAAGTAALGAGLTVPLQQDDDEESDDAASPAN